jgi:hypothetical protein
MIQGLTQRLRAIPRNRYHPQRAAIRNRRHPQTRMKPWSLAQAIESYELTWQFKNWAT